MTLNEMATHITGKLRNVGLSDSAALAKCKGFLRQRFKLIRQDQLWRDSVGPMTVLLHNTDLFQSLTIPEFYAISTRYTGAGIVILFRTNTAFPLYYNKGNSTSLDSITDGTIATTSGWITTTDTQPYLVGTIGEECTASLLPYRFELPTFIPNLGISILPDNVDEVLAIRTAPINSVGNWHSTEPTETDPAHSLEGQGWERYFGFSVEEWKKTGTPYDFTDMGAMAAYYDYTGSGSILDVYRLPLIWSTSANDVGIVVTIDYRDAISGSRIKEDLTLTSTSLGVHAVLSQRPAEVYAISKPATSGTVYFGRYSVPFAKLTATETNAPLRQVIRLFPKPDKSLALRVLTKRRAPTLTGDNDEPDIRHIDNCLMALAQGDMLESVNAYGKAQAKFAEGNALLEQMKKVHIVQRGVSNRLIPRHGYGDEHGHRGVRRGLSF